jgi:hypothetical protein
VRTAEDHVTGSRPHDHLCLVHDDIGEFRTNARRFLGEGLARGQQVRYVAGQGDLAPCGVVDGLHSSRPGAVQLGTLGSTYPSGAVVEPHRQVQEYATATAGALAGGFTGFRVAVDVTALVRSPEQLDAFARYEHLVDRYMTAHPFAAMCGLNRAELGAEAVAELACMHPGGSPGVVAFRLHAAAGFAAALRGEVDGVDVGLLVRAVRRAELVPVDGEIVIDASAVTFVSHRALLAFDELGGRLDATVVLRTSRHIVGRVVELLGIARVRVVPV